MNLATFLWHISTDLVYDTLLIRYLIKYERRSVVLGLSSRLFLTSLLENTTKMDWRYPTVMYILPSHANQNQQGNWSDTSIHLIERNMATHGVVVVNKLDLNSIIFSYIKQGPAGLIQRLSLALLIRSSIPYSHIAFPAEWDNCLIWGIDGESSFEN
jgi:hypothetical protein